MRIISCAGGFVPYENIAFLQVYEDAVAAKLKTGEEFTFSRPLTREQAIDLAERVADAVRRVDIERVHINEDGEVSTWEIVSGKAT